MDKILKLAVSSCVISLCLTDPVKDIIQVDADCGTNSSATAKVYVTVDRNIKAKVKCGDGNVYEMQSSDGVHYEISATYTGDSGTSCVFLNSPGGIYTLEVFIARLHESSGPAIQDIANRYLITCIFDDADDSSANKTIDDSKSPSKEVIEFMAGNITSPLYFAVIDVKGDRITGEVPVGKTIRLHARLTASNNETGIRAISCEATNSATSYSILLGGCGDGLIFTKQTGFTTNGYEVHSPFFRAFRLHGDTSMLFRCSFTACMLDGGCDGSSCV